MYYNGIVILYLAWLGWHVSQVNDLQTYGIPINLWRFGVNKGLKIRLARLLSRSVEALIHVKYELTAQRVEPTTYIVRTLSLQR